MTKEKEEQSEGRYGNGESGKKSLDKEGENTSKKNKNIEEATKYGHGSK